uniref:Uncharacterized protein n=1 Tax=Strigamia maritima TaxID=126957 RepID=T1JE49_STRMM
MNINRRRTKTRPMLLYSNPQTHRFRVKQCIRNVGKILLMTSVLVSFTLCAWQLATCLEKYIAQPVGTYTRIEKFNQYTLPGLTICPCDYKLIYDFDEPFKKHCNQNEACNQSSEADRQHFPFGKMNITLLDLWQSDINFVEHNNCRYVVNFSSCKSNEWLTRSHVGTTAGPCQVFQSDAEWYFSGKRIPFSLTQENARACQVEVQTSKSFNVVINSGAQILKNHFNRLNILETRFEYLNTTEKPCGTRDEEIECINKWIYDQLQTHDIECKWPFLNSTLPLCDSMSEVQKVRNKIRKLQYSSKHNCKRPCSVTVYQLTMMRAIIPDHENDTMIALIFSINTRQIVWEYFTYPFSTLVSEVGGNIGLFLGYSLLSCFKYFFKFLNNLDSQEK